MVAGSGDPSSRDFKRPINPKTGQWGSATDPRTWGTFEEAMASPYPLKGFVFSKDDPYSVIDLDTYKAKTDDVRNLHAEILRHAETYKETSQSGFGTHIIGLGSVPEGANNEANSLEVYSDGRFMVCTGRTEVILPVVDIQELLDYLYPLLKNGGTRGAVNWRDLGDGEEGRYSDAELIEAATNAENGDKFLRLCQGDMSDYGGDHSDADMALIQFLCFYTPDNVQVARLFHMSNLSDREKAHRPDYVPRTIARARQMLENDKPPLLDISVIAERARTVAMTPPAPATVEAVVAAQPAQEAPRTMPIEAPPGLIGELAAYVEKAATLPVPEIALAAAIAVVAGIAGRNYNISTPATGLNQYILLLAKTGTGKESVQSSVDRLFTEVQKTIPAADRFLGPANFSSGPALVKRFGEQPCFVSILGEFGDRIQQMAHPRANGAEKTLMAAIKDIYHKSGWHQKLRASVYSDKEKNTGIVHAPALTILGETAPETFFASLDESLITGGFLPRFLTIEYTGERPKRNKNAMTSPPADLVQRVADLCSTVLQMEQAMTCYTVQMDDAGRKILDIFDAHCDDQMMGQGEVVRHLWNRAYVKALRLAALVAVGVNPYAPVVTHEHAQWAINMVKKDVAVLHTRFVSGDVGEGDSKLRADLVSIISKYLEHGSDRFFVYHKKGCVPMRFLAQQTANRSSFKNHRMGANRALKDTLENMVATGELSAVPRTQLTSWFSSVSAAYAVGEHWDI